MIKRSVLSLLIILAASCRKELILPPTGEPPIYSDHPELLWRVLLDSNKQGPLSMTPIVFGNDVIASSSYGNPKSIIIKYSGETGAPIFKWNGWIREPGILNNETHAALIDDKLVIDVGTACVSLDPNSMQPVWHDVKRNQNANLKQIQEYKNLIYSSAHHDFSLGGDINRISSIITYQPNMYQIDTVHSFEASDDFGNWAMGFGFGTLPNGDDVIVGKLRRFRDYRTNIYTERMGVFAYNLTQKKLLWEMDSVEVNHWGGATYSLVDNGLAFIAGHNFIHCFELETGQKKWSYALANPAFFGTIFAHKGRILFKDGWDALIALDPISGNELWHLKEMGICKGRAILHNDKLFYISGGLWVVSADNGLVLYKSDGADWDLGAPFLNTPALDLINRRIYLCDGHTLTAIKMLDDW